MKNERFITIAGEKLAAALKHCAAIVETRNTFPVLGMVRLAISGDQVVLSATDLDIIIDLPLRGSDGSGKWSVCLPLRPLEAVARLGREGDILIEAVGSVAGDIDARLAKVTLDQGNLFESVSYEIDGLAPDSFPEISGTRGAAVEQFGNGGFSVLIRKVSWAASFEETRYYLNGVAWEFGPNGRRLIATDGHRLAICRYDRVPAASPQIRVLPNKLVALLQRFSGSDLSFFDVAGAPGAADLPRIEIAAPDGVTIRAKLVELPGSGYPDVDRVTPRHESFKAALTIAADAAIGALDRVMAFVSRRSGKAVSFDRSADGRIELKSVSVDTGTARVVLPVEWPEGAVPFGVNGVYLKGVLRHCTGEVVLHQVDSSAPLTVLDGDETMTRLLMPMRV